MYHINRQQLYRTSLDKAWNFLKNPANLNTITPPDLLFRIISPVPKEMHNGLLVEYRIKIPLFGVMPWLAEIKHIRKYRSFVDEQRVGPYSFWYHYHELQPEDKGILVIDTVYYTLPWGPVGRILHFLYIRPSLKRIFDYRRDKLFKILEG